MKNTVQQLKHLVVIPDGNRRWARERGLDPWRGHFEGAKRFEEIAKTALELDIKYLTIWAGSYDNLTKRSKKETSILERIYKDFAIRVIKDKRTHDKKVRLRIIGEWPKLLNKSTVNLLKKAEEITKNYGDYNLTLLIGYNGDREMLSTIKKIAKVKQKNQKLDITDNVIKDNLWTRDLPEVDFIIRTGEDSHLSAGFMMWDVKYAQLYFSEKMWPSFTKTDLKYAIKKYEDRDRRRGK